MSNTTPPTSKRSFQAPKGTRDFYPEELLRRRYIAETWRAVSIRHGFEEIDGPTFEHADLYTVKSGEGILSELFSFRREGGDDLYALRPEFTPTLARMYAARARQLPSPTRWFCIPNFFRAENPQRGRLREFYQWNVDVIGGDIAYGDAEILEVLSNCGAAVGATPDFYRVKINHRSIVERRLLINHKIPTELHATAMSVIDASAKTEFDHLVRIASEKLGMIPEQAAPFLKSWCDWRDIHALPLKDSIDVIQENADPEMRFDKLVELLSHPYLIGWFDFEPSIVRGLAYYTGTVFEVIAEGERAIAGGGRYDNLVELFGGPPTPACGFGMGDVVLSLVLEDRGLMPKGMGELMDAVECVMRSYSMRPDAFVFSNGDEAAEARVVPLLAELRRGVETPEYLGGGGKPWRPERYAVRPLHARTTGKTTRNVGKLMKDAATSNARFAVVIETGGTTASVKNLDAGTEPETIATDQVAGYIAVATRSS